MFSDAFWSDVINSFGEEGMGFIFLLYMLEGRGLFGYFTLSD